MKKLLPKSLQELNAIPPAVASLLVADSLLTFNELALAVIVPWWITSTGGVESFAIFSTVIAMATFMAVPVASPFGDRYCKSTQISYGAIALGAVGLALALLSSARHFNLALIVALACVQVAARSVVDPARATILAELVHPDRLPAAIRARKTCQSISGIVGPLLGGLALSTIGVYRSLLVCAAIGIAAAASSSRLPRFNDARALKVRRAGWWRELGAGLAAKWHMPMERGWTIVNFVVWIFQGPAVGMLIPIKVHALGLSGSWLGACMGALSLGALAGSLFGSQWLVDRLGRYRVRVGIGLLEGIALATVGFAASPHWMVAALFIGGFCNASMSLVGATHRMLAIPKGFRVRIVAASAMTTQLAGALGPALVGIALSRWNVNAVYGGFGLLMAASVLGFMWVPRLNEFLTLGHDQIVDWYLHEYPAIFRSKPG